MPKLQKEAAALIAAAGKFNGLKFIKIVFSKF